MAVLAHILLSALAVFAAAHVLPGVHVSGFGAALVAAIALGFVNGVLRPVLLILTLPLSVVTLGLFTLVVVSGCVMLVSWLVPGFDVDGWLWGLAFALVLALLNGFFAGLQKRLTMRPAPPLRDPRFPR